METQGPLTQAAVRVIRAAQNTKTRKGSFLVSFVLVFLLSTSVLASLGLLPEAPKAHAAAAPAAPAAVADAAPVPEYPTRVDIPALKTSVPISNPNTTDIQKLDDALLSGAVRYPSSSKLGEQGNVILFGHSSYLPIVNNPFYKTFDGIQNLKPGDRIMVTGTAHTYVYAVESVQKEDTYTGSIPLSVGGSKLALATCNSFASKDDRFVVTANLVESDPLGA